MKTTTMKHSHLRVTTETRRDTKTYCKFGNFRENCIFANSVKTHICDVENSRQWRDLPLSENDRVISSIRGIFYFHETSHMRSFAKIRPSRNFRIYSTTSPELKHTHARTQTIGSMILYHSPFLKFLLNESMGANGPLGVATLDPRDMVGR